METVNLKNQTLIQFNNLSLNYSGKSILETISGAIQSADKIGLVGINGSGKTSLLKCIAGIIPPTSGEITSTVNVEYVPQLNLDVYRKKIPLYKHLESHCEEWWNVFMEYEKLFQNTLDENRLLNTLSGGELVKLTIALALAKSPDVLLLDEPTNHLDLPTLKEMKLILQQLDTPFVVVSHDVDFLNSVVSSIWELENAKLTRFGGTYDDYKTEKNLQAEGRQRKYIETKKELKKHHLVTQQEKKRASRSQQVGKKISKTHDRSTDRFATGFFKNSSEKRGGVNKLALEKKEKELQDKLSTLKAQTRKKVHLDLQTHKKSGLLVSVKNGELVLPDGEKLVKDITFNLYYGDRIAITGRNGTGKTTFVKQLRYNQQSHMHGEIVYGDEYKTLFVDQKYDVVDPGKTIITNLKENNKNLGYEDIRRILSNLDFASNFNIKSLAGNLSGGETARLAFAIATSAPVDLLVLDEPTNNLDIETIETISEALKTFEGTLVVISHDTHFLKEIGIEDIYEISNQHIAGIPNS